MKIAKNIEKYNVIGKCISLKGVKCLTFKDRSAILIQPLKKGCTWNDACKKCLAFSNKHEGWRMPIQADFENLSDEAKKVFKEKFGDFWFWTTKIDKDNDLRAQDFDVTNWEFFFDSKNALNPKLTATCICEF